MRIAIAQLKPVKAYIDVNIERHKQFIALAVNAKADAVFFPELSLTGYEPKIAKRLALHPDDPGLEDFQHLSNAAKITIGVGLPTTSGPGVQISMLVFQPGLPRQVYSKQQLHQDERPFFVSGSGQLMLNIAGNLIAPAICFESLQPSHAAHAAQLGAQFYLASVAKSEAGVRKAEAIYPTVARKYNMPILMSNCIGYCDNFTSAGNSSVWNAEGELLGRLDTVSEGILVFDTESQDVCVRLRQ